MIKNVWKNYLKKRGGIANDQYIIMPNHMHGIIFIVGAPLVGALSVDSRMVGKDRAGTRPAPTKSLGVILEYLNQCQPINMQSMLM